LAPGGFGSIAITCTFWCTATAPGSARRVASIGGFGDEPVEVVDVVERQPRLAGSSAMPPVA
jgi:hypothetical protein